MLRDPLAAKKCFADHFGPKNKLQKPEKTPLEPLDLLATVGQSCVCECQCVSECVCVVKNDVVAL